MNKIFAVCNQKGGIGKTTTSFALMSGLMLKGYKVLGIDLDPQANFSFTLKVQGTKTVLSLIAGEAEVQEVIQSTQYGDFIAASPMLAQFNQSDINHIYSLHKAVESIKDQYDFCVIDTPPSLGILTMNALTAADSVIIPVIADAYSVAGIVQLVDTINAVHQNTNEALSIEGILLTRYVARTTLTKTMCDLFMRQANKLGTKFFDTKIRDSISVREAQVSQKSLFEYAPKSTAAQDYLDFIDELLATSKINAKK